MIWSGHNKLSRGVWDTDRDLSVLYLICAHRHRVITLALGPKISSNSNVAMGGAGIMERQLAAQ